MSLFADDLVVSILEQDMFSAGSRGNSFVGCTSAAASRLPQLASGASFSAQDAGAVLLQQQQQADPQDGVAAFCARTPLLANMMGPSPRITPLDGGYINQVFKIAPEAGSGPAVLLKFAPPYTAAQPDMPIPQVCGVARGAELHMPAPLLLLLSPLATDRHRLQPSLLTPAPAACGTRRRAWRLRQLPCAWRTSWRPATCLPCCCTTRQPASWCATSWRAART